MKCVKIIESGEIFRVSDLEAQHLVKEKFATFTTKEAWRKQGRKTIKNIFMKGK